MSQFPALALTLRPYQERAIEALRAAYAAGRRAPCLVLPCGGGKTIISAALIFFAIIRGTRCLFIADRSTLIVQTVAKLAMAGVTDVRVIQAQRDDGPRDALVTVASAQTLRTPGWQSRMPDADLVIWDECHGVVANTYAAVFARYPAARRLGLTATPCRGDNKPLDVFDELVVGATIRELTELGHLARCRVLPAPRGALQAGQIALDPVTAYQRHAGGARAAVFCSTVDQALRYTADFAAAGFAAEAVTAETPDRDDVLARFAAGAFRVLCSVGCLTQGWDDPGCGVAILVRKPDSLGPWIQMCGRVLRPHPDKQEGLILDLGGAFWKHGPPDAEVTYSLSGKAIRSVVKDSLTQCRTCGSGFLAGPRACPYCGAVAPVRPLKLPRATGIGLVDPGAEPAPKPEYLVPMTSTRGGYCASCFGGIRVGDPILWATQSRRARHRRCPSQEARP